VGPNSAGTDPINFVSPGAIADADIVVDDDSVFQPMAGFGGTLSPYEMFPSSVSVEKNASADSSALTLKSLKV